MKNSKAEVMGYAFGVILVSLILGFVVATFVAFVIGLFVAFPLTVVNVLKVWLALLVIRLVLGGFR